MKNSLRSCGAFSLVEVTLAIGIAAFCLIAVFGLMPVGIQTNRNATSQTAATNVIAAVVADLRATPTASATSSQFGITFGSCRKLYFDGPGQVVASAACDDTTPPPETSRYRLSVSFPTSPTGLSYADVKVTWPAAAAPANASGSVEMFAAFDRN
jgi:type II secretory pathway pseudopilin PulG